MVVPNGRTCQNFVPTAVPRDGHILASTDEQAARQMCSAVSDAELKKIFGLPAKIGIMTSKTKAPTCEIEMEIATKTTLEAATLIVSIDRSSSWVQYKLPTTNNYNGRHAYVLAYGSAGDFSGLAVLQLAPSTGTKGVLGIQIIRATRAAEFPDVTQGLLTKYLAVLAGRVVGK